LEDAVRKYLYETITVMQGADLAGVSYETMLRKIGSGKIPNAGRRNKPLVRRCDILPGIKAQGPCPMTDNGEPDIAEQLLRDRA